VEPELKVGLSRKTFGELGLAAFGFTNAAIFYTCCISTAEQFLKGQGK
jgi:hypothetical protein